MRRVGLMVCVMGCLEPTQMMVTLDVESPLICKGDGLLVYDAEIFAERGRVDPASGTPWATEKECRAQSFGTLTFTPAPDANEGDPVRVMAIAQVSKDGIPSQRAKCIAQIAAAQKDQPICVPPAQATATDEVCEPCVSSTMSFRFIEHTPLRYRMALSANCQGVFCKTGETCGNDGVCVADKVDCIQGECGLPSDGGAGGANTGGNGGAGGAGGAPVWTPLATVGGKVNDIEADIEGAQTSVYVASGDGFYRCSLESPNACTELVEGDFVKVTADGGDSFALKTARDSVYSGDGLAYPAMPTCAAGSVVEDIAYSVNDGLVAATKDGVGTFFYRPSNNMCGGEISFACPLIHSLENSGFFIACVDRTVVLGVGVNGGPGFGVPTGSASAATVAGADYAHFICADALFRATSTGDSPAVTPVLQGAECTFVSAVSKRRLVTYQSASPTLSIYPLDDTNSPDVLSEQKVAIPPGMTISAIDATATHIVIGGDTGVMFIAQ
jgi:hypothetical protein